MYVFESGRSGWRGGGEYIAPIVQLVSALDFNIERLKVQSSLRAKG